MGPGASAVRHGSRAIPLVALFALAGCFSPNLGDAPFACGAGGDCPSGYTCSAQQLCVSASSQPTLQLPPGTGSTTGNGSDSCAQVLACAEQCADSSCVDGCR